MNPVRHDDAAIRARKPKPIEDIPDWEERLARQDAFWHREVIDRPLTILHCPAPSATAKPAPRGEDVRAWWLDAERLAQDALAARRNTLFLGDALPTYFPNLGPEVFSAFFGMDLEYTWDTAYGVPCLDSWADADKLTFTRENFFWRKLEEMTDAMLQVGEGVFYTGYTDLHPGADCIAAWRDPANLNMDLLVAPDEVQAALRKVDAAFEEVFDAMTLRLLDAKQAISTWAGIVSRYRWHVPSNDFSCMISKEMFDEFFMEGIAEECRVAEANLYHLDGPGALRHLDSLLEIPELDAVQWVAGAGHGTPTDWLDVYRRCQEAGKGIQIVNPSVAQLATLREALRPEGVCLLMAVDTPEEAEAALREVERWR